MIGHNVFKLIELFLNMLNWFVEFCLGTIEFLYVHVPNSMRVLNGHLRQTLIRYTPNCTTYSFPRLSSNGLATIVLFLCNKWRFLEFSEGQIVSKYTLKNCDIYQHSPQNSMPSNPPRRYMTTIYHYFVIF